MSLCMRRSLIDGLVNVWISLYDTDTQECNVCIQLGLN